MSLLLEALKKAELAKQQGTATQPPDPGTTTEPGSVGLTLEPVPGDVGERPLITRDRLPDITQPLEILSEDLPSAGARRETPAPPEPRPIPTGGGPGPAAPERASRAPATPAPEEQDRLSARQLFEAKDMDYNPRRPFFIALGALGLAALVVVGYFLFQLFGPAPSYYTGAGAGKPTPIAAAPTTATPATPAAAPASPPAASATAPAAPTPPAASTTPVPPAPRQVPAGAAPAPPKADSRPQRTGETTPRAARAPALTAAASDAAAPPPRAAAPAAPTIRVSRPEPRIEPGLERAWRALEAGDLPRAKEEYLRVLAANALDRDALLGLATIDVRTQDFESAEARYFKVLELDPRDPYAQAGIIALRGQTDPAQSESRLKNLLIQQPEATFLNFALGNQYARQGRWEEAQSAYFRAYSADPENPEYAYNLAVSLDQLHQPKLALEYYERALALAGKRAVGFNSAQVEARVRELTR
jgi:Tfp pilus assembly protein PilF